MAKDKPRRRKPEVGLLRALHLIPGVGNAGVWALTKVQEGKPQEALPTFVDQLSQSYAAYSPIRGEFNFGQAMGTYLSHLGIELSVRAIRRFTGNRGLKIMGVKIV